MREESSNRVIGRKPVLDAINSGIEIEQVIISFSQQGRIIDNICNAAKRNGIKVRKLEINKFRELENGANTQGVIAITSELTFLDINELIEKVKDVKNPILLLLDSVQDPHNLGAILRTADSAGVNGVITTIHESSPFTDVVTKTSAGADHQLNLVKSVNLVRSIEVLKKNGFWIVGTSLKTDTDYTTVDYNSPIAVVVGNEAKGIRPLIEKNCDFLVKIPMLGKVQSLNVSVSSGVMLYEILKQRKITAVS